MTEMSQCMPEKSEISKYIGNLGQLADQAWQEGFTGLQETCLLLADALRGFPQEQGNTYNADMLPLLDEWPALVEAYRQNPKKFAGEILNILRHPGLALAVSEEEFEMLAAQLYEATAVANNAAAPLPAAEELAEAAQPSFQTFTTNVKQLADQAAQEGLFGLQDACLLLADALGGQQHNNTSPPLSGEFLRTLAEWPALVEAYRVEPATNSKEIVKFLRRPELDIPLNEDEVEMLAAALATGSATPSKEAIVIEAKAPKDLPTAAQDDREPPRTLSRVTQEIIDMLQVQTDSIDTALENMVERDSMAVVTGLQQAEDELERLGYASETAGFGGLARICMHVNANIRSFREQADGITAARFGLLHDWIREVKDYLATFSESNAGQSLVFLLNDEHWALPLPLDEAAAILMQMRAERSDAYAQEETATRKQHAEAEDVSLTLPEDVNQELLDLLLQELPVQTQQFSEAVQRLQTAGSEADVQVAQRIAHTLKGSANTVGIKGIAVLTHNLEDILTACAKEQRLPKGALGDALMNAADCLEGMSETLAGLGEAPDDAQAVLQEILDWANRIDLEGVPEADAQVRVSNSTAASETAEVVEKTAPTQAQASMVRVPTDQLENLFRLSGESIILNTQAQENMRQMKTHLTAMQGQFALLQQLGGELERLIDLKDLSGRTFGAANVNFDMLEMDQYNELHTVSRRMAEAAIDAREISLDVARELYSMGDVLGYQQRLVIDAQEVVMQTRLVPINTIVPRLQRSLRQTCRLTGKQCDLRLSGENILIDGDTLNSMVDPLLHVLRNAVDHGIESEAKRLAQGKSPTGKITFQFDREGNNILVRCRDDGHGLDYAAIRAIAEKRGLLQPGQEASEEELKRIIVRPNFSTRTVTTQTSGRGVGMDVVRSQVVMMGGSLALESKPGAGLSVEIRVPLPLSLTYALLTHVGQYRVAISNKGVTQIVYSAAGELVMHDGKETLLLEGETYTVARLADLLHVADQRREARAYGAILLVQNEDKITAVLVEPIIDSMDVVIKGMGYYVGKVPGFIGATILGDGAVTPVLDIPELLRAPARPMESVYAEPSETAEPASMIPTVLVVDDSLSQRRALEQLLSDAGFRVRTARDGIEAAEMLAQFIPDMVLTDLEMPRMNGIELVAHVRTHEKIKSIPLIMITSRTTQKHRQMAEAAGVDFYLTKPVRDEDLLVKMNDLLDRATSREHGRA